MSHYRERLSPSLWVLLSTALVLPASIVVFAPIGDGSGWLVGAGVGVVLYGGLLVLLIGLAPVLDVENGTVRVGRATIPAALVGACEGYRGEEATTQRGRSLDARAYLCIRGWIDPVVKMEIADPQDPTPYWLVSTRRPGEFIDAVTAARRA
ncbi:DUF3093 domain-containing protein [Herbiconiux daphne]|uniref:DUF3093 domain-containing protein n=1 Tax=Herbiconiux daphne TaxID=2970914 RepID=A0ABT2GZ26_9MICO|nr:DUF3093 domain-containing protein [Herbiconiux daphne]MCS5733204.1 DUF3093 domain-containing protein [Herbiconiux daphne]